MKNWDETNFHDATTANVLGSSRYLYVPFHHLRRDDEPRARALYPHKSVGAKYDFVDEHYYYPTTVNGRLALGRGADRVLAIPLRLINDDRYMKQLGYSKNPGWAA